MWRLLITLACIGMISPVFASTHSNLSMKCAPSVIQEQLLRGKYKEESVAFGITDGDVMLTELWISEKKNTWTITLRTPTGTLCGVLSGKNWRTAPKKIEGISS